MHEDSCGLDYGVCVLRHCTWVTSRLLTHCSTALYCQQMWQDKCINRGSVFKAICRNFTVNIFLIIFINRHNMTLVLLEIMHNNDFQKSNTSPNSIRGGELGEQRTSRRVNCKQSFVGKSETTRPSERMWIVSIWVKTMSNDSLLWK
jgi:hypothetical protein